MFDFIRTHQRFMQFVLLVLILPSFALIGVSGYTNYVSGDQDLVKVADTAITTQDFDQARRYQLQEMQNNSQGGFDPAVLDNPPVRAALLESLIDRRVIITTATKERFSVSDTALRQTIAAMPQLQVDGQFSPERYNDVLASAGMTIRDFEQSQRAELALDRVLGPVALTSSVPTPVVKRLEQALTEQRSVRLMTWPASDYRDQVVVSDADIQAWYDANKQTLQLPEQVSAQYLLLDEAAAMDNLPPITEDDLKAYYQQNKARYMQPARINLSHIQINIPSGATQEQRDAALEKAKEIAKEAQADKAGFADLARAKSEDAGTASSGGSLGWISKGSWLGALEQTVFTLKKGDVSEVVDGPGGYHIFMANDVQPEQVESFDQVKPQIQAEVSRQLGSERFADMATRLTGLIYDNPESLQPAADALGLKVKTAAGIARDRLLSPAEAGQQAASAGSDAAVLDDVRVRSALFMPQTYTDKQNSGVIEISPDTMLVVRVDTITPAQLQPLDKVADTIRQVLLEERAVAAAEAAGQQALAGFQAQTAPAVPEGFGDVLDISRVNPQGLDKPVLDAAFSVSTKDLPHYAGVQGPQGFAVVRVEAVKPGDDQNPLVAALPGELNRAWGQAEQKAVLAALRVQAKVDVLPEAKKVIDGDVE
ncbi:MAG: SurA N-terminal domain-containing protein [Burkholderiaceae bacterium]|nr:SurA N-terminal domain-containing protein [Burkholderiaceae bacterium]